MIRFSIGFAMSCTMLLIPSVASAVLVKHWTLDGSSPYTEAVTGNNTITVDVAGTLGSVTSGQAGIAPDGGTSVLFANDDEAHIYAGTVQSDGTYVDGVGDGTHTNLGGQYAITAWVNLSENQSNGGDRVIFSTQFTATLGMLFGVNNGTGAGGNRMFVDFGNTTFDSTISLETSKDYFVALVTDTSNGVDTVGGGTNRARVAVYDVEAETWSHEETATYRNFRLQNMTIGKFRNGQREFEGLIDDVRLYDNAFTLAELDEFVNPGGPTPLQGDFNGDGTVDAADYTLYVDNLGQTDESAFAPGTGDGLNGVDPADYTLWRNNFGNTTPPLLGGGGGAVPEPGTIALLISGVSLAFVTLRKRSN